MPHDIYEPVIGLEVHCQLNTVSKLFSSDAVSYGSDANSETDPLTLGHPGTLPVLNERALEFGILLGIATNCRIARSTRFDRKHYFYPDLPKGYQITQHDAPLCTDGYLLLEDAEEQYGYLPDEGRPIKISRIILEEDAGRLKHDTESGQTFVDYNRSGIPLLEVVTGPEIHSPREATHFLRKLQQLVRYLGISTGDMEKGAFRCDANISLRETGSSRRNTKCEIKNLNSFSHIEQALEFEIARQLKLKEDNQRVRAETRLWDEKDSQTRLLRTKEKAADYRFMPEPDLPPVKIQRADVNRLSSSLPEMAEDRARRFQSEMGISDKAASLLTRDRRIADFYEETVGQLYKRTKGGDTKQQARDVANVLRGDILEVLNEKKSAIDQLGITPDELAEICYMRHEDELSSSGVSELIRATIDSDKAVRKVASDEDLLQESDRSKLLPIVNLMLDRHSKNVQRYLDGKKGLIRFFMGQVMSNYDGSPNPKEVRELLEEKLEERR